MEFVFIALYTLLALAAINLAFDLWYQQFGDITFVRQDEIKAAYRAARQGPSLW